jgi:hypothetical protein
MMRFLFERTGLDLRGQNLDGPNWFCVTVRDRVTDEVVAALACEFKTWFDVHFSAAIDQPDAITRPLLYGIFSALFAKARRITALVEPSDSRTESIVTRLGFVYEGFSRLGFDGDRDALIYGMLPQDCNFLPGVRAARSLNGDDPDGQPAKTAQSLRHSLSATAGERGIGSGQRYH